MLEDDDMEGPLSSGPALGDPLGDEDDGADGDKPTADQINAAKLVKSAMGKGDEELAKALKLFVESCKSYMGEE